MKTEKTIRVCIADDEPIACRRIARLLKDDPEIEVVQCCTSGDEAVDAIKKFVPDLVFLDIQMPGKDGFEVLESLKSNRLPHVVFVTAYDRYAIQAFEIHALDYLLKPFHNKRFLEALNHAKAQIKQDQTSNHGLTALLNELKPRPQYTERLMIRSGGRVFFLKTDQIDWIEAQGKYVYLHSGSESYLVREGMNTLQEGLDPQKFVRIHKSTIVNLDRTEQFQPWFHGDYRVIMQNGKVLTLSRRYRRKMTALLGKPI